MTSVPHSGRRTGRAARPRFVGDEGVEEIEVRFRGAVRRYLIAVPQGLPNLSEHPAHPLRPLLAAAAHVFVFGAGAGLRAGPEAIPST